MSASIVFFWIWVSGVNISPSYRAIINPITMIQAVAINMVSQCSRIRVRVGFMVSLLMLVV